MLIGPTYIQNIEPEFCVRGCDVARACKGYITSEDTKWGSYMYMQYIGPISILYTMYDGDISCIVCTEWSDMSILKKYRPPLRYKKNI